MYTSRNASPANMKKENVRLTGLFDGSTFGANFCWPNLHLCYSNCLLHLCITIIIVIISIIVIVWRFFLHHQHSFDHNKDLDLWPRPFLGKSRGLTFLVWDVGGQEKVNRSESYVLHISKLEIEVRGEDMM